jgi:hypothetical protein
MKWQSSRCLEPNPHAYSLRTGFVRRWIVPQNVQASLRSGEFAAIDTDELVIVVLQARQR